MANFKLTQTKEQIQADLNLLDSNSATAGQVLTANGTGGASWQNAASGGSGGGTQLYMHSISITAGAFIRFALYSTSSVPFRSIQDVFNYLPSNGNFVCVFGSIEPPPQGTIYVLYAMYRYVENGVNYVSFMYITNAPDDPVPQYPLSADTAITADTVMPL